MLKFNREAFTALLRNHLLLHGTTAAEWARGIGISPGYLHDLTKVNESTGKTRKQPGPATINKLAAGLGVPVGALVHDPARAAS